MIRKASSYSCLTSWAVASAAAVALLVQSVPAHAEEVSGSGKGITGGALLGGEAVMLVEAIAGVKPAWAYIVGGLVGAGGGAAGGYFIEKDGSAKASSYMLAGGLVLLIPTTVAVLQATSYTPPEDYTEDKPIPGAPVPEPPRQTAPVPGAALPRGGAAARFVGAPLPLATGQGETPGRAARDGRRRGLARGPGGASSAGLPDDRGAKVWLGAET